jgi:hypothetical protein
MEKLCRNLLRFFKSFSQLWQKKEKKEEDGAILSFKSPEASCYLETGKIEGCAVDRNEI